MKSIWNRHTERDRVRSGASSRSALLNAALYQAGWFACVLGAARGWGTAGAATALALVVVHLALVERLEDEVPLLVAAGLIGITVDSLHARFGILEFTGHQAGTLAPLWIVALWIQFASALHYCMRWLSGSYLLASALGLVGGPLSFLAGERLGAASFGEPRLASLIVLGLSWSIALPAMVAIADRLTSDSGAGGRYRVFSTGGFSGEPVPVHVSARPRRGAGR